TRRGCLAGCAISATAAECHSLEQRPLARSNRPRDHRIRARRCRVTEPRDIAVRPYQHQLRLIGSAAIAAAVADDLEWHAARLGRMREACHHRVINIEGDEREAIAKLLEHIAARREQLRWQVMAGPRLESMRA